MVLRMRRDLAALWLAWLATMLLDAAPARGWQLLNIKSDWKVVFPFGLPRQ